jgi:hypothetical protein
MGQGPYSNLTVAQRVNRFPFYSFMESEMKRINIPMFFGKSGTCRSLTADDDLLAISTRFYFPVAFTGRNEGHSCNVSETRGVFCTC